MASRVAEYLPGYAWDAVSLRYRNLTTGRFVARTHILGLLENFVDAKQRYLTDLTRAVHEGRIAPATWAAEMRVELKRLHIASAALGAGGFDRLTSRDYGRIGGHLAFEYRHLAGMAADLTAEKLTLPQALNRLRMYLGNARREFFEAEKDRRLAQVQPGLAQLGRRLLGAAEHCADCVEYYNRGWQYAVDVPVIGASQCDGNCRCSIEWRTVPVGEVNAWLGSKR